MFFRVAADGVLLLHLAFIGFALLGGLLVVKWRWMLLIHLPAVAWAFLVEVTGRACPLTSIENTLRLSAGQLGYTQSFVEHYVLALVYPSGLTRDIQIMLAAGVAGINIGIYAWLAFRRNSSIKKPVALKNA